MTKQSPNNNSARHTLAKAITPGPIGTIGLTAACIAGFMSNSESAGLAVFLLFVWVCVWGISHAGPPK